MHFKLIIIDVSQSSTAVNESPSETSLHMQFECCMFLGVQINLRFLGVMQCVVHRKTC